MKTGLSMVFVPLLAALTLAAAHAAAEVGKIRAMSGEVSLLSRGAERWRPAQRGAPVAEGDRVRTGERGRVMLQFGDGSTLMVGNSSEIEVTRFVVDRRKKERTGLFSLLTGKLRAVVAGYFGTSDVRVRTRTSTAGVKGTDFVVMNEGDANVLFGTEGEVEVSGDDGGSVVLTGGAMTENTRGIAPITPVEVERGTALDEVRETLLAVTDVDAPVEWEQAGRLADIMARWNINYGHYLADSGRYDGGLRVFRIAVDMASEPAIKAEAHLARGTVYSRYLGDRDKAMAEYMTVVNDYPELPHVETALYSAGLIEMDAGNDAEALELFRRYLRDYPDGRHGETIKLFIRELEKR
ncbi:MAG TPA: tetratricopeptide repeat protein [Deltaproteobacteria bacterium]|nr:tetratricopeptide repeat protein [Deltaproteobacteria bacterium]